MQLGRNIWALLIAGAFGLVPAPADAAPDQIEVGGRTLVRAGDATREERLLDLYRVSLYLPSREAGMERITRDSVPKAFHVEVLYDGSLPGDIPDTWSEELLPPLPERQEQELQRAYRSLGQGDELRIAYAPGAGTTVQLNGETVLTDPGPGLMAGMVDVFLGPDPTSESVRQGLLGRAEDGGWLF